MNGLHITGYYGHFRLCKVLLEKYNFDLHIIDHDGSSALLSAAEAAHLELFEYFLEKFDDLYREKNNGMTCLHIAALNAHLHFCTVLLEKYNFDLHMNDDDGNSALLFAAEAGHLELFKYLQWKRSNIYI